MVGGRHFYFGIVAAWLMVMDASARVGENEDPSGVELLGEFLNCRIIGELWGVVGGCDSSG